MKKRCSKCKEFKDKIDFWKNTSNGTLDGLHSWCKECVKIECKKHYQKLKKDNPEKLKEYAKNWRENNRERARELSKKSYHKRRYEALCAYGGTPPKCKCCGEKSIEFLSFDHINGGGLKHLKEIGRGNLLLWIRKNNYPKGFQILCHNCNFSKGHYGYCPHKQKTIFIHN